MRLAPEWLVRWPKLNLFSFFLSGTLAWLIGGQVGPQLQRLLGEKNGYIAGGIIGGMIPVAALVALGWYGTR